jgi:hypothetical protein
MRYLLLMLLPVFAYGQDSCAVFDVPTPAIRMMGYMPDPPSWKNVNYVVHIHHTDSLDNSFIPYEVVYDADYHLNEEFEEALFSFNLIDVIHHDFDDFWASEGILGGGVYCVPYSQLGYSWMNEYVEEIAWDQEEFMNVHVFPEFCNTILGFAWTAHNPDVDMDGVWIRTDVFGRFGDHLTLDHRDENKTMIHEVGHYLSLHHVFKNVTYCGEDLGECYETGDYVCDTPPTKVNWSCENPICPPGLYDYTPNNHMDYYVDSCRTNFTEGQINRMHSMLPITRPGITDDDPYCVGDINGDLMVGVDDMLLLLSNLGNPGWGDGDINGDGYVSVIDFQILLMQWGVSCYGADLDPLYMDEQFDQSVLRKILPYAIRREGF